MSTSQSSVFTKTFDPVYQALLCFGAVLVFTILGKLIEATHLMEVSNRFPWMTAATFMLFFAMLNSVFSLSAKNMGKYWGRSIYSFMGLTLASGLIAYLFSATSISQAGSYRWIFLVLTLGYLVFLSMMTFIRRIVEFAQKEEWNHPRIRRKR